MERELWSETDTGSVRAARNAYAALLLLVVSAAYASVWLLPLYGSDPWTSLVAVLAAAGGAVLSWAGARSVPEGVVVTVPAFLVGALAVLGLRDAREQLRLTNPGQCDANGVSAELPLLSWRGVAAAQLFAAAVLAAGAAWLMLRGVKD